MRVLGSAMPVSRPAVTTLRAELRPVPDVGGGQRAGSDRRQPLEPVAARPRLRCTDMLGEFALRETPPLAQSGQLRTECLASRQVAAGNLELERGDRPCERGD